MDLWPKTPKDNPRASRFIPQTYLSGFTAPEKSSCLLRLLVPIKEESFTPAFALLVVLLLLLALATHTILAMLKPTQVTFETSNSNSSSQQDEDQVFPIFIKAYLATNTLWRIKKDSF